MKQSIIADGFIKKTVLVILLMSVPTWVAAQNEQQMQYMMEQAKKAQACMAKLNRGQLEDMASKAQKMEAEIKSLCAAGKRDEAQSKGMKYGLEMSQSKVAKDMRECSKMMSGALAGMGSSIMPGMGFPDVEEMKGTHICDAN